MGNIYSRELPESWNETRLETGSSVDPPLPARLNEEHRSQHFLPGTSQNAKTDIKDCSDVICIGNVSGKFVNINTKSKGRATSGPLPGTLTQETLKLRISDAEKTFIVTESFKKVQRKLDQFGLVTLCGASGEGKTTMALMASRDYMEKGYEVVFVEKVDMFEYNEFISSTDRVILIVDDIFGTVGLSSDVTHIRNFLHFLNTHVKYCRDKTSSGLTCEDQDPNTEKAVGDIRVVFTSKTYNFKDAISKLFYEKHSIFNDEKVVDLTTSSYCYSHKEKLEIFDKYKSKHPEVSEEEISNQSLSNMDTALFGFPLTCRLFFEFPAFRGRAGDYFKRPLFYLRIELNKILSLNNNQSAALILMLLCDDKLDLCVLEGKIIDDNNQTMDVMFEHVKNIVPNATPSGIAKAARNFRGTFFSGGDSIRFAHSSVYDGCACAMYTFDPSFVLNYCSLEFLYDRLKPGTVQETDVTDDLHFIFVSDRYHDLIATRLVKAFKQGHFAKTITQPMLKNEWFSHLLIQKLQDELSAAVLNDLHWIHHKDKEMGFLFWAIQGHSPLLVHEILNMKKIRFSQSEIIEALDGCVEKDSRSLLELLLLRLEKERHPLTNSRLLLLNAKNGSWDISKYLLENGASIYFSSGNRQNYIHLLCKFGKATMFRRLKANRCSLVTEKDYMLAIGAIDVHGRTPAMVAALYGSWECFQLCEVSKLDKKDRYNHFPIHLACIGGNKNIVKHLLLPSNINCRGRQGWTPAMYAAVCGHQSVFALLQSNYADLTLVDDSGDSLLHLACQGGNRYIVQHVLTPDNINSRGTHCCTPIMVAAQCGKKDVFDFLVSQNADVTLKDCFENGLLNLACQGQDRDIVQDLLTSSNINSRGEHGWTPLMHAAVSGQLSVFNFLVSKNADFKLVDDNGNNLLHLACRGGSIDIVRHLFPSLYMHINSRGMHGWTPVMFAAVCGQQTVFEFISSNNADLSLLDDSGDSLLHLACQGGNTCIVKKLLTRSNVNKKGMHGWTPIMKAAVHGDQMLFKLLADSNADLTLVDAGCNSLLHLACQGGNREIVQHLLTSSDANSRGKNGWTPIMMAAYCGHIGIIDLLVENQADLSCVDKLGRDIVFIAKLGGRSEEAEYLKTLLLSCFRDSVMEDCQS